jgi:hypothetical protein
MVGFDESGNTGPDLLNSVQPVFVLASVGLSEDAASAVLGPATAEEHHSVKARKSRAGRDWMLSVLEAPELVPESVKVAVMHKRFVITAKFVDLIIEPILAASGYDLYRQGGNLALANLLHMTWPAFDKAGADELWSRFVSWARNPVEDTAGSLSVAIERIASHVPDGLDGLLRVASQLLRVDPSRLAVTADMSSLDPAGPALLGLIHAWASQLGPFDVAHDDSTEVKRWIPYIRGVSDPAMEPVEVQFWNGEILRYPLPVGEIALPSSETSAQIQLADVIAGAGAIALTSRVAPPKAEHRSFAERVLASRFTEWVIGASLWPTNAVTPEELGVKPGETQWPIDRIVDGW